jgi:hypothetical protein
MIRTAAILDPWNSDSIPRPRSADLDPSDAYHLHHLIRQSELFSEHWGWAVSRARHPAGWDQLRARLLAGEEDERLLLEAVTLGGATGEEVLLVIQACHAFWDLQDGAIALFKGRPSRRLANDKYWWDARGWLPHMGGPDHQNAWGLVRSYVQEGRFRAIRYQMQHWSHRQHSDTPELLREAWREEVRVKMTPYVDEAEARWDRTPSRAVPEDFGAWLAEVVEADAFFMRAVAQIEEAPRETLHWSLSHISAFRLPMARLAWLSVAAGWVQIVKWDDKAGVAPLPEVGRGDAGGRGMRAYVLSLKDGLGEAVRAGWPETTLSAVPERRACEHEAASLAGEILRWAGRRADALEVFKRWG